MNSSKPATLASEQHCGLANNLAVAEGAKVMLRLNLWTEAGLTTGVFKSTAQIRESWGEDRRFSPAMDETEAAANQARWEAAVRQARTS